MGIWERRFVSVSDAAKILGRSRQTIHNWIRRGWLKANRVEGYNRTFIPILTRKRRFITESVPDLRR